MEHRESRAVRARELQVAAAATPKDPAGWVARTDAIRASTISLEPLSQGLIPSGAAPWYVELAEINFGLRTMTGRTLEAAVEQLQAMLVSPEVSGDPMAVAQIRNAIGCAIVLDVQRLSHRGVASCTRLEEGAAWFASVCQIPEAALNEAGVHLELARLRPDQRAASLAAARAALERLDSDALSCTFAANSFLGFDVSGARVLYVIDASSLVSEAELAAAKEAVVTSLRGLPRETRFAVIVAAEDLRMLPAKAGSGDKMVLRGDDREERQVTDAETWLRTQVRGERPLAIESLGAIGAIGELAPSEVFFIFGGDPEDPREEASAVGRKLADGGAHISVFLVKPGSPSDVSALELVADGSAGRMARGAAGRMRLLAGGEPLGIDRRTLRSVAESGGRWTPVIARQESAVRALLALMESKDPAGASASAILALQPLVPDPVTAEPGPSAGDWQVLMLNAAAMNASGDTAAADRFALVSKYLVELSKNETDANRALYFRELSARAQLLRALTVGNARDPAFAQRCIDDAQSLGLSEGTWSIQLLNVLARSHDASRLRGSAEGDILCAAELSAIEAIVSGTGEPPISPFPADTAVVDAEVFRRALVPLRPSESKQ